MDQEQIENTTPAAQATKRDYMILGLLLVAAGLFGWALYEHNQVQGWKDAAWDWKQAAEQWQKNYENQGELQHSHAMKQGV